MRRLAAAAIALALAGSAGAQLDPEHDAIYREAAGLGPAAPQAEIGGDWTIEQKALGEHRYLLSMRLARLHTGGDGDARSLVVQRAQALARRHAMAGFEIVSLQEGVRSGWLWGQRFALAEIRLLRSEAWPRM